MPDAYGPFDGVDWAQAQWYRHAPAWAPSGVFGSSPAATTTGDLALAVSGRNLTLGVGRAWVRGAGFERTGTPAADAVSANTNASLSRRDRLVLRRDLGAKTVTPVILTGTAAASPVSPTMQRNDGGQWDLPLFSWLTPPNSGTTLTDLLDERGFIGADGSDIPTYVSTRARDAAIPTPVEEQKAATRDGRIWQYNGSRWEYIGGGVAPDADLIRGFAGDVVNQPGFDPLRSWKSPDGAVHVTGTIGVPAFSTPALILRLNAAEYYPPTPVERTIYAGESRTPQRLSIDVDGGMTIRPTQAWGATYWVLDLSFLPKASAAGQP